MGVRVLAIDDDHASCRLLQAIFAAEGMELVAAHDRRSGIERAAAEHPDLVLLDLRLPDGDGLELLEPLRAVDATLPVVMLTAHADVKTAVRATQLGAFDYLTKPIDPDEIVMIARRALETRALRVEVEALRRRVGDSADDSLVTQMGPSPEVARVVQQVEIVAASGFSVLVLGETGTGKELVAQAIHRRSERRTQTFIAIDCGAIPEPLLESELFGHERGAFTGAERKKPGRFHLAEGGSFFLDEVGNLPLGLQAKLLRVLESREVVAVGGARATPLDVRFIAAANDDLQARASDGRFRADLFFRLAQYTITLPPLRARVADIAHLAQRFVAEAAVELRRPTHGIAPDALAALERHGWPGNVRELRNVIRQAVLEANDGELRRASIQRFLSRPAAARGPARPAAGRSLRAVAEEAAREAERQLICETLRATRGNKAQAARVLETDYKTLHVKMKHLGIRAKDFSP